MEPSLILLAILVVAVLGRADSVAVAAAAFLGGVPVGPLVTSGILAVAARLIVRG